jgi:hypothetical protein
MTLIRHTGLLMVVVSLLACSSDRIAAPVIGFEHASLARACGPADGPAAAFYFTPVELESDLAVPPYVRVGIDHPLEDLGKQGWTVTDSPKMYAVLVPRTGDFEVATDGYLTTASLNADNSIDGTVDLNFPTAGHLHGQFHAVFVQSVMLCG